jgi:hypothetical protein
MRVGSAYLSKEREKERERERKGETMMNKKRRRRTVTSTTQDTDIHTITKTDKKTKNTNTFRITHTHTHTYLVFRTEPTSTPGQAGIWDGAITRLGTGCVLLNNLACCVRDELTVLVELIHHSPRR